MLQESYKKRGDSDPDGPVQIQGSPGDKNARYSQHSWKLLLQKTVIGSLKRGRRPSRTPDLSSENEITIVQELEILAVIRAPLGKEFVCYGYKKVNRYLQRSSYKINRKRVFRIMKEKSLLNHTYNYRSPARRVVESIVRVNVPNAVLEMDIKYIYIQGENRTTCFFATIVCFTRGSLENILDITAPLMM